MHARSQILASDKSNSDYLHLHQAHSSSFFSSSSSSFSSSPSLSSLSSSSASSSSSGTSTSLMGASGSTPNSLDMSRYTRLTKADGSAISYPDSMSAVWKSTCAVSNAAASDLS